MKILIIGQLPKEAGGSYTTGVCNVVYELSKCKNTNVEVVVYATNVKSLFSNHGSVSYYGTKLRIFKTFWDVLRNPFQAFKRWRHYKKTHLSFIRCEFYLDNIRRIIKATSPDVVHCMNIVQMAPAYFAATERHIPTVLTVHGVFFNNDKDKDLYLANSVLPDYVTGLTPETVSNIVKYGIPSNVVFEIPNGTDTSKFYYSEEARSQMRKQLGVEDDETLMMTVGSLQHRKGQLSFCRIISNLPDTFKYKYLIIGSGSDEEKLNQYIHEHNLENKVLILGYVDNTQLYKYHSAADVYIHGSYAEGQALSEVEAYSADLKIAVNKDILGTVVTDTSNRNDYFVFDYEHFDNSAFVLWASHHKCNRITRRNCDWNRIFEQYVKMYNTILK